MSPCSVDETAGSKESPHRGPVQAWLEPAECLCGRHKHFPEHRASAQSVSLGMCATEARPRVSLLLKPLPCSGSMPSCCPPLPPMPWPLATSVGCQAVEGDLSYESGAICHPWSPSCSRLQPPPPGNTHPFWSLKMSHRRTALLVRLSSTAQVIPSDVRCQIPGPCQAL